MARCRERCEPRCAPAALCSATAPSKASFCIWDIFFFPSPCPQHPPHVTPWCRGLVPPSRQPAAGARPCWCLYCKHQLGLVPSKSPRTRKRVWVGDRSSAGCRTVPCLYKKRDRSLSSQGTRLLRPRCWSPAQEGGRGERWGQNKLFCLQPEPHAARGWPKPESSPPLPPAHKCPRGPDPVPRVLQRPPGPLPDMLSKSRWVAAAASSCLLRLCMF